jgi:hypothetical protein
MMNRYNTEQRLVTPLAQNQAYQITPAAAQQLMQASQADNVVNVPVPQSTIDNVFTPQAIGKDPYSPVQRAMGLAVRCSPFAAVYLILAIGIAYKFGLGDAWLYLLFGIPMLITTLYMSDRTDRYTPAGVEIERIAAAERTEFTKGERQERILTQHLAHKQELARMALEASIKMLGGSHDK